MATLYKVHNGASATTGPPTKVATGISSATKTMLQIVSATFPMTIVAAGYSFDEYVAAIPVAVELCHTTTVPATGGTAFVANDITCYSGVVDAGVTTGGLTLGTGASGYSFSTEGSSVAPVRDGDLQLVAPSNQDIYQWQLGQGFYIPVNGVCRIRMTNPGGTAPNAYCWIVYGLGGD